MRRTEARIAVASAVSLAALWAGLVLADVTRSWASAGARVDHVCVVRATQPDGGVVLHVSAEGTAPSKQDGGEPLTSTTSWDETDPTTKAQTEALMNGPALIHWKAQEGL